MNNAMFEWGKNCATLGFDIVRAHNALISFGNFCFEDCDQFWRGFEDGPRDESKILEISPEVKGK